MIHFSEVVRAFHAEDKALQDEYIGHPFTTCTNICKWLRRSFFRDLGHARVVGYYVADNPTARIGQDVGGHDFLLLQDRFIIDLWYRYVYGDRKAPIVLDMTRPQHSELIKYYYGDVRTWVDCATAECVTLPSPAH